MVDNELQTTISGLTSALQSNRDKANTGLTAIKSAMDEKGYPTRKYNESGNLTNIFEDIGNMVYDNPKVCYPQTIPNPAWMKNGIKLIDFSGTDMAQKTGLIQYPGFGRGWRRFNDPRLSQIVSSIWVPEKENTGYGYYVCILSTNKMMHAKIYCDGRPPEYEEYTEIDDVDKTNSSLYLYNENIYFCDGTNAYQVFPVARKYEKSSDPNVIPNVTFRHLFTTARTAGRVLYSSHNNVYKIIEHNEVLNESKIYSFPVDSHSLSERTTYYTVTVKNVSDLQIFYITYSERDFLDVMEACVISATVSGSFKSFYTISIGENATYNSFDEFKSAVSGTEFDYSLGEGIAPYNVIGNYVRQELLHQLTADQLNTVKQTLLLTNAGVFMLGNDLTYHLADSSVKSLQFAAVKSQLIDPYKGTIYVGMDIEHGNICINGGPTQVPILVRGTTMITKEDSTGKITISIPKVPNKTPAEIYMINLIPESPAYNDMIILKNILTIPYISPISVNSENCAGLIINNTNAYDRIIEDGLSFTDGGETALTIAVTCKTPAVVAAIASNMPFDFYVVYV